jgi:hypothetical protein
MYRFLAIGLLIVGSTVTASAGPIKVWESHESANVTEGETTLEVDPDTAYAAATDYAKWPAIFPDIARVEVKQQKGVDARVRLVHQDGNVDNVHFHNTPQAGMVWFEDTGGHAEVWAEIVFVPGDRPGTTRVRSRLFAEVHGVASVLVGSDEVRTQREKRISNDLMHLHTYFSTPHVASH